ncbi:HD domain-containing phosphohydrolase [Simiduia agarivorans]|uniref:Response regulator receiver modulated metal dependent phosphohydrolase n=1 Tax=Simiduia agarivorans (strain DSM 21679 / JCM 13881 / BCRC 17597 / SA1) TaxID=1117647 RepID=K4L1K5_SIMAS|nr:HD domain-containing phosphohydrolase [Simiduia agarivorans]AFV00058.1 response regulator receiver modulated metal dependent phosphohydrolase [Simiduia agarivorans SA1 = DSM 21679]
MKVHQGKVLIVDDNAVNIVIVEKILRQDGFNNIYSTTDAKSVRDLYREHDFDAILLDVHMPEMNGFDVMAELQADNPDDYLPILMLTADHTPETRHLSLSSGAKDFISKPFERVEVLFRVRNIVEVRMLHKEVLNANEVLEDKVRERTQQLYEAQIKLIECLGKAAEYRDNETGMHVVRMSQSSALLARQMGLSAEECEIILHASPMHDIGKIAIPDSVLLKPGKLEGKEWRTMQSHAEVGAQILASYDSKLMEVASIIARTHHERWDGKGYPEGLQGEEIPLYTRIVSVCDVFDALTSTRPYKVAWPVSKALGYLKENSGSQFDPQVVNEFIAIIDQVLEIRQQYPDSQSAGQH